MLPSVTSPPQRPTGRQNEKMYDVSVHILARSLSPSVRTATTTDTNWFSCHAAEVTQTTWAQTRGLPLSGPLRSLLGTLAEQCACIAGVATMCDACLVNTENHYLELCREGSVGSLSEDAAVNAAPGLPGERWCWDGVDTSRIPEG